MGAEHPPIGAPPHPGFPLINQLDLLNDDTENSVSPPQPAVPIAPTQ